MYSLNENHTLPLRERFGNCLHKAATHFPSFSLNLAKDLQNKMCFQCYFWCSFPTDARLPEDAIFAPSGNSNKV